MVARAGRGGVGGGGDIQTKINLTLTAVRMEVNYEC